MPHRTDRPCVALTPHHWGFYCRCSPAPQNVAKGEWQRIEPVGRAPLGRDHHSAVFFNGSMFVFGECIRCLH